MAGRQVRHRILVAPLQLQLPPSAGEQRSTGGVAVDHEEATAAEPAAVAAVPRPRRMRMRSCRVAATGIDLPDEIVVWEIFLRLPSKAILCCRAVCRSWRGLTSARLFLLAHHRRQPLLPLVALTATERGLAISDAPAKCSPPILAFDDYQGWMLHASCDGLLLLSHSDGRFTISNPATRQCAPLPCLNAARHISIAALYLHRPSGDYRVLYCKRHPDAAYYILNVGQGRSSRCIGIPAASAHMEKVMRKANGMVSKSWNPPMLLRNLLHWDPLQYHGTACYIVIFDMVAESFRLMPGPAAAVTASCLCTCLNDIQGSIGLSCFEDKTAVAKIWVLEDYDKEVWSLKYRIQLPVRDMITNMEHMVLSHHGNMLVCYYFRWYSSLFHSDGNGKLLEEFSWGSWMTSFTGHWFRPSLVKHPFFPIRGADCVKQPYFFRRL